MTGTVSDQSDLKVNVKFKKRSDDQEFGIVLSPGTAWETQSVILSEAASTARLERTKDKSHGHNKLERMVIGTQAQHIKPQPWKSLKRILSKRVRML